MTETEIIESIAKQQVVNEKGLIPGTFPSYRENKFWKYKRKDSNIFATASTLFLLKERREFLSEKNQKIVDEIIKKATESYSQYQNKDGFKTYNFYPTKPSKHFSPGYLLKRFSQFKLADDVDDTSMIYLTSNYNYDDIVFLKDKLKMHSSYNNLEPSVYSTWFGNSVPIEYDVCVLCNLMLLIAKYPQLWNAYDEISLKYLKEIIKSNLHFKNPFEISRHYGTTSHILYHYSRLTFNTNLMDEFRDKLTRDIFKARQLFKDENSQFLLDLSEKYLDPNFMAPPLNKLGLKNFYFFIGAPFFAIGIKNLSLRKSTIFWRCESLSLALQLYFL